MSTLRDPISLHDRPGSPSHRKHWWFVLRGRNGKTLMTSETYTTKRSALNGIKATRRVMGAI